MLDLPIDVGGNSKGTKMQIANRKQLDWEYNEILAGFDLAWMEETKGTDRSRRAVHCAQRLYSHYEGAFSRSYRGSWVPRQTRTSPRRVGYVNILFARG